MLKTESKAVKFESQMIFIAHPYQFIDNKIFIIVIISVIITTFTYVVISTILIISTIIYNIYYHQHVS